jgi:molecular chaperone HscB
LLAVKKRFYQLSREYHPDFFSNESAEEKDRVLSLSAMVNKAYQVFQDTSAIIKYVLQLKGLLEEEEKYQLSPNFLMEVMDLNELLMDATDAHEKSQVSN